MTVSVRLPTVWVRLMADRVAAHEAAAVDDGRAAFQQRFQQQHIVARIVLQVGILDDDDIAGGLLKAGAQRSALAAVDLVEEDLHVRRRSLRATDPGWPECRRSSRRRR